jgi:hypothetical protein
MDPEEIIINLKLLQQVEKGQKLVTRDAYLNIETGYLFIPEGIRRWRRQDNRNETIKCINRVINDAITLSKKDSVMKNYIRHSKQGIMNLKETYSMCHQTCARLDMILDKIKGFDLVMVAETVNKVEDEECIDLVKE